MKKVLFVGHINDKTKQIQKELSKFVSIQLCSDNVTIAESMMGIYEPDLVLVEFSVNDEDSLLDEIGVVPQQHITLFKVAAVTGYLHDSASRMGV